MDRPVPPAWRVPETVPETVRILGTHGVPAAYGGFETAAEHVGLLPRGRRAGGSSSTARCRRRARSARTTGGTGIERVHHPDPDGGWRGTSHFDLQSIRHAVAAPRRVPDVRLQHRPSSTSSQRVKRIPNVINMDGIEWSRSRWGFARQAILSPTSGSRPGGRPPHRRPPRDRTIYLRARGRRRKISTITYGAHAVADAPTAAAGRGSGWSPAGTSP